MGLFEQRISDDDVAAAREKIAAGASLRSAAAQVPCAPSTLSLRIKKAERAEAGTRDPARLHAAEDADAGARAGEVGPVATLRGALHATKASGQPDWPTRVSAARALATLRPQELEPTPETPPAEPTIIVYDLPPGANPVLHRPQHTKTEAPVKGSEAPVDPPAKTPPPDPQLFYYRPANGDSVEIGQWSPAMPARSPDQPSTLIMHTTDNPQKADRWRAELSAGRLPTSTQDEPQHTGH